MAAHDVVATLCVCHAHAHTHIMIVSEYKSKSTIVHGGHEHHERTRHKPLPHREASNRRIEK